MTAFFKKLSWKESKLQLADLLPFLILLSLLGVALFFWNRVSQETLTHGESLFYNRTEQIKNRIKLRLQEHEKLLRGGLGLFNSVGDVSRTQWRQYVSALELDQNHPGIQGIGYSVWLKPKEVTPAIRKIRSEGFPEFTIKPLGDRINYTSIIYLEPFNWRNQRAFGFDMYSEPIRRKAMDQAIDRGLASISNKIILVQETEKDKQNGILMYLPVYRINSVLDSKESRRLAIKGFVYSPIRMTDFILATIGNNENDIKIEITDQNAQQNDKTLYNSLSHSENKQTFENYQSHFERIENLEVFNGLEWNFSFKSLPNFDSTVRNNDALFILIFGILGSLIAYFITFSLLNSRKKALALAREKTKELKTTESSYQAIYNNSPIGIIQLSASFRFISANPAFVSLIGITEAELQNMNLFDLIFEEDQDRTKEIFASLNQGLNILSRYETRYIHRSGRIVWTLISSRAVTFEESRDAFLFATVEDITQARNQELALKQAEKLANESQQRYRSFFEKNSSAMLIIDPNNGSILDSNKAAQQFYGWSEAELKHINISQINITPDIDMLDELIQNSADKENHFFFQHRDSENNFHYVEIFSTPIQFLERAVICAIVHDITDRRTVEHELKLSAERFRTMFNNSPDPFFIMEIGDGKITDCNTASEIILGASRAQILGKTPAFFSPLLQPDGRPSMEAVTDVIQKSLASGKHHFEWVHQKLNGTIFWTDISISVVCLRGRQMLFVAWRDITERKRMEKDLLLAASVFSNSYDGILIADEKNVILDISPSFSRITGYDRQEVIGKTPKILSSGKHDTLFYSQMWESLNQFDFWSGEVWNQRKNGEVFPEMLSISAVKNNDNKVQHYVAIFSDISDIKRQQSKLIEARKQAEEATLSKSRFLATMSHEIRTPMNGVLGMAQLLVAPNVTELERLDYAQTIINSGNVLLTLLNDILDLSKVEAGKIELENFAFEPNQLIHETLMLYSEIAQRKSLVFEGEWLGPASQFYISDPYRLRQMLSNLISNAIKFTERGKIRMEIRELRRDKVSAVLEFSVTDTGIGIPQNKVSCLFEPFSQVDNTTARKYGGTGLGLSIVANLARLMRGQCGASSVVNEGSRFWFTVSANLINSKEQNLQYWKSPQADLTKFLDVGKINGVILVVDDDPINRKVIEKFLVKLGFQVIAVENGQLALEVVTRKQHLDLILMDLQMPVMDGYTTTQQIRLWEQEKQCSHLKIIAFTADAFEETKKNCLAMGMDDIITKPISMGTLKNLLTHTILRPAA